jgi:hypothetical protein
LIDALTPSDPSRVISSNAASFRGGIFIFGRTHPLFSSHRAGDFSFHRSPRLLERERSGPLPNRIRSARGTVALNALIHASGGRLPTTVSISSDVSPSRIEPARDLALLSAA